MPTGSRRGRAWICGRRDPESRICGIDATRSLHCPRRPPAVESITASVRSAWRCSRQAGFTGSVSRRCARGCHPGGATCDVTEIHDEIGGGTDGAPRPVRYKVQLSQSAVIG